MEDGQLSCLCAESLTSRLVVKTLLCCLAVCVSQSQPGGWPQAERAKPWGSLPHPLWWSAVVSAWQPVAQPVKHSGMSLRKQAGAGGARRWVGAGVGGWVGGMWSVSRGSKWTQSFRLRPKMVVMRIPREDSPPPQTCEVMSSEAPPLSLWVWCFISP